MKDKGIRQVAGIIDILLGIALASISIYFYLNSSYEYYPAAKYIFFCLEMIVLPLIGLFLIVKGIINLVKKDKQEEAE